MRDRSSKGMLPLALTCASNKLQVFSAGQAFCIYPKDPASLNREALHQVACPCLTVLVPGSKVQSRLPMYAYSYVTARRLSESPFHTILPITQPDHRSQAIELATMREMWQ